MKRTHLSAVCVAILVIITGCGGAPPQSYGCNSLSPEYNEHVEERWIESPNITTIDDLNDSVWGNLSNDSRYWLDNHSNVVSFNMTHFMELTPGQQDAFLELRDDTVILQTSEERAEKNYDVLSPYFHPTQNGNIIYDNSIYYCDSEVS